MAASPRTPVIYEIVRRLGAEEMARPSPSLWWSGVAAGFRSVFRFCPEHTAHASSGRAVAQLVEQPRIFRGLSDGGPCPPAVFHRDHDHRGPADAPNSPRPTRPDGEAVVRVFAAQLGGHVFAALFCTFTPALTPELKAGA